MTGAAARATSHRVLKQSGDLLNWRLKSRRSQTPIAELGQCSTMRSVVGNRIHADGADIFRHQGFLVFRPFVVEKCAPGVAEERGDLRARDWSERFVGCDLQYPRCSAGDSGRVEQSPGRAQPVWGCARAGAP